MEFLFYLVLILALVAVAGFMLFVRFSAGRDKALHHSPLALPSEELENSQPADEIVEPAVDEIEIEEPARSELPAIRAEAIEGEKKDDDRKSEYLDELQEAAAGLAMLMRSSASNRTTPVVFAPEEEEETVAAEEKQSLDETPIEIEESVPEIEADSGIAEITEIETEVEIAPEPEKKTLSMLLGSDVAEQFGKIDSDLDALESLVVDIESSLSVLAPVEESGEADDTATRLELTEAA